MNSLTHIVAPEEIMALLDGELTSAEAKRVEAHVAECGECAALREELLGTSEALAVWAVPGVSAGVERAVMERAERVFAKSRSAKPRRSTPLTVRNWRLWAIGGGGAIGAALACVILIVFMVSYDDHMAQPKMAAMMVAPEENRADANSREAISTYANSRQAVAAGMQSVPLPATSMAKLAQIKPGVVNALTAPPPLVSAAAPMIARSVAMTVLVKNIAESRSALDGVLAQHHGYAAQLTVNTPENGARSFQSSLRIPAGDLAFTLDALRMLGKVQTETQSGEEVTQQHTDLVARLTNARETETRLRAILQQRAGKMQDVLDVEEKISETRGEIEQMEAEQKELEHRVDFATIELQLTEEYKAQLGGTSPSVGNDMSNALVAGLRHAGASLLGMVLFAEEFGPVILIWLVILGVPAVLVWRRFGRSRDAG